MNSKQQKTINLTLQWRKNYLNKHDVCDFTKVPKYIIDAFFGEGTYRTRLLVSTFGYVNGIHPEKLVEMVTWKPVKAIDRAKVIDIYSYLDINREKAKKYYSYNANMGIMMFCDGSLRINGERKLNLSSFD